MADTEPSLANALQALDLAVLEWLPDRTFRPFAPPPPWFKGIVQWSSLPFLEHVLPEAETLWRDQSEGVLVFGPFALQRGDEELLVRVRALRLGGCPVMAIDRITGEFDPRPMLRTAREQALDRELLEQRARNVHAPAAALAGAVEELRRTAVSSEQAAAVESITRAVAGLQEVVAALPAPYRRRR